ncbi:putative pleckstrin homology domain [Lyophyllum shimeji]|uniref:Pleckstrin homology domain n=1 Tax=Lyophyllum shimeji TaxID=47721 RepID=A0A9P3URK9_LYOSH|nr:putative pleckstrin homology domain [Lyophyllum shimeji]
MEALGTAQRSLQPITNVPQDDVYGSQTLPDPKSQQNQFQFPSTELPMPLVRNSSQTPQQRPSLPNPGHSRSSSFFSFRSKQSLSNQQIAHQRTESIATVNEVASSGMSAPAYGTHPAPSYQGSPPVSSSPMQYAQQQQQQPARSPTTSAQSSLAQAPTVQPGDQPHSPPQPLPQPPPLHPEIRSVVQLTAAHAHKIYFSGPLVRRIERQPDGQRPAKDEGWVDVWAQLGGTTLSIWDMKEIQEASRQGREVPPSYVNTTDAFVQVLGAVTTPATATSPPKKYANVLTLNTAGSNLLLFSCPSTNALISWAVALRLSAWEKSRLEEIYTAHLIRITLNVPDAPSTLLRGRMEGWVRIRVAGQTDWKRMWMVVSAGEGGPAERPGAVAMGSVPPPVARLPKKKRMSNLFSRDSAPAQPTGPMKPMVSMYASPKPKDKKNALLTLKDVTQAFAVYPERPELISRSTLIKVEGAFGDEDVAGAMKSREGWLLIMPELEAGLGQAAEMLKWVVALHDAFELYGRPQAWTWDPRDPISLMFAYPVGPNKDLLFLDRELAETLDPRDDRTSSIRSRLLGILADRMRGHGIPPRLATSDKPPTLPPIGGDTQSPQQQAVSSPGLQLSSSPSGPQLPPLSFAGSTSSQPPKSNIPLTPITELSSGHTNGRAGSGDVPHNPRPQPVQATHYPGQDKSLPDPNAASVFNRPLTSSPDPLKSPPAVAGVEPQTWSPSIQNADIGPVRRSFDAPSMNRGFQVQSRVNSNTSSASNLSRTFGDGTSNAMNAASVNPPNMESRPTFSPSAQAPVQASNSAPPSAPASPPTAAVANGPPLTTVPARSASVLTSPHSVNGHEDDTRHMSDRVSILTSPHSPAMLPATLSSPYSPHGTLRSSEGRSSRAEASPPKASPGASEPPAAQTKAEETDGLFNEAGALYYMQQQLGPQDTDGRNQHRRVPTTISEDDGDDDSSSSSRYGSSQQPPRQNAVIPTSNDVAQSRKPPVRQSTPMAFVERTSSQGTYNKMASSSDRSSPSRQGLGRKPSGARAQARRSYNGDGVSSQHVTEEEETQSENEEDRPQIQMSQGQDRPSVPADDPDLDALAALSYLAVEDKPSSPKQVNVEPLHLIKAPSPPPAPAVPEPPSQFKSSFAPSKQAAQRKAKAQAQQAAHHAAVHKPGRANGKRKSRIAGAWNESSEEEEEEEDDEEEDADSDAEPPVANRRGSGLGSSNASLRQTQSPPNEHPVEPSHPQYSHLRPPRTLPQIPGSQTYPDEYNTPPRRMVSDQYSGVPPPRMYHDGTQIRTQSEFPQPGAARQSVWSQVLDPGRPVNTELPRNDTFVHLEPSETMTKAFTPQGLLSAGMQDKQDRSAKRQEELARETGASLINVPNKPPPPQMGLLGAITAHERERKREGGVGAALTEREREKRMAEERQRRFDEHQRNQLDQMQQGGSIYGGQFPANYMNPMMMMNPMMAMNPMMTGGGLSPMVTGQGMAPMMTGQMGYPGMMAGFNPQHMFAAQQAAQAYQQAMMAFSVAGSQVGGEGATATPPLNPAMTGGNFGAFDPRMSMMGMPMMGQMAPMGMQMTGMSTFDPRFPPNMNNSPSMNDAGLAPPAGFGGQGQPASGNSSPARRGSPLARQAEGSGRSSRPESPKS